jgi:CBS domain-containing protein
MSPNTISELARREPPTLHEDDTVQDAARQLLDSGLPALPVLDGRERYVGIFGEREFMSALFPGYLKELKTAAFLHRSLDEALEKRDSCRGERVRQHMNTEHVDVGPDFADTQVAEIFLHHRVLVVPVVEDHAVTGLITRADFFRTLAERFLDR